MLISNYNKDQKVVDFSNSSKKDTLLFYTGI